MIKFYKTHLIEAFKKQNNLSTTAFCKLCNICLSTYKRIFSQNGKISARYIVRIIKVLKISLDSFLYI